MKPRFYVSFIQYNKEAEAENRVAPSAFDTESEAIQKFHEQMGKDMKNATLGWSVGIIFDNFGNLLRSERWTDPDYAALFNSPEESEEPAEEPEE